MKYRPYNNPGTVYGVGLCIGIRTPERAFQRAVENAFYEICSQMKGECGYHVEFNEETDDSISVDLKRNNRTIRTITGLQVKHKTTIKASESGFPQDTLAVMVSLPKSKAW